MNEPHLTLDVRWPDHGLTMEWFEEKAAWMRRDRAIRK
jgi:hypothetical protein